MIFVNKPNGIEGTLDVRPALNFADGQDSGPKA